MIFHSPPIFCAQSCLTVAVIIIFRIYCLTDTYLTTGGAFFAQSTGSTQP